MIIRTNTSSLRVYNAGRTTKSALSKNLEKISSGYRINRAADDAAGLAVSERIHAKVTEMDRCQRNASEGMDLTRTADAALQEINDMLKRARGLCIQAENGTYGDQELTAISGEMNQLFREIDRITAGSYHNTICLFRQGVGITYHEEVVEHYTPVGEDLQIWGGLDFIEKDIFERASTATPATAIFELDDSIDPSDPNTMEGKALTIGSRIYYFTTKNTVPSVGYPYPTRVAIGGTMEATLENLVKASSDISAASIDGRKVTLAASLKDLKYRLNNVPYTAKDGDGEWAHNLTVTSPTGREPLGAVDGTDASDNQPTYRMPSASTKLTYTLPKGGTVKISDEDIENLKANKFHLYLVENDSESDITVSLASLDLGGAVKTWGQFGNALRDAIKAKVDTTKYTVAFSGKKLTVTYKPSDRNSRTYLYTDVETGKISSGTGAQTLKTWTSQGVSGFKVTQDAMGGAESQEQCTVEIPDLNGQTLPISFSVNGRSHLFYNPNDPVYTAYTSQPNTYLSTSATYDHRVSSVTAGSIANEIDSYVESALGNADVTVSGNKLIITAESTGTKDAIYKKLQTMFSATPCTISARKGSTGDEYSKPVISDERLYSTVIPRATVTFNLGSDPAALEGKGFSVDGRTIEFINSDNRGSIRDSYYDIDLKTADTLAKIKDAVADRFGSNYTVTLSGTKLSIVISTRDKVSVTDGVLGMGQLSKGGVVKFEGGANAGHSQKAIDFSSINEDNLDTLMGKGFRINCATCPGEYINIFFCWKDDSSRPKSFQKFDPTMGEMRTIHNISVELSKVTSGDKIVENIVEQVRPSLNHYTDLMVGDPPTILLAMEKRIGDVIFDNELKLGSVETSIEANFTYSVERKLVADLPKGDLEELETAKVNIYVGSDPEPQIIPIHLPYIDLYHLRLFPPESGVDLIAEDQDPTDWLGRIDRADRAISSARGTIGADYNQLEHAIQDLSNAHIQLSDAYSVIRDADMAELMKEQMKLQILMDAQQSMQAQANQEPQGVLRLIQ